MEYLKLYCQQEEADRPVVVLYEVDPAAGRLVTRLVDVFADGRAQPTAYRTIPHVSDVPLPPAAVINAQWNEDEDDTARYFAENIDAEEFLAAFQSGRYEGDLGFPEEKL